MSWAVERLLFLSQRVTVKHCPYDPCRGEENRVTANNVLDPCKNEFSFTRLIVEDMLLQAVTLFPINTGTLSEVTARLEFNKFLDWRLNSENDSRVHGQPSWLTMDRVLARIIHEFPLPTCLMTLPFLSFVEISFETNLKVNK